MISFDLATSSAEVLLDGLYFPNGVVYDVPTRTLFVNELNRYRILRVFTEGERKGQSEVFADNFIGFLDNMKQAPNGDLLIGNPTLRDELLEFTDHHPIVRKILLWLP